MLNQRDFVGLRMSNWDCQLFIENYDDEHDGEQDQDATWSHWLWWLGGLYLIRYSLGIPQPSEHTSEKQNNWESLIFRTQKLIKEN